MWHFIWNGKRGSAADQSFVVMRPFTLQHKAIRICDIAYETVKEPSPMKYHIWVLPCVAVCCSVLQCDTVCCSVLQCVAVWKTTWWWMTNQYDSLFYRHIWNITYMCCSMLQCERPHDDEWLISVTPFFTVTVRWFMSHMCIAMCCSVKCLTHTHTTHAHFLTRTRTHRHRHRHRHTHAHTHTLAPELHTTHTHSLFLTHRYPGWVRRTISRLLQIIGLFCRV